MEMLTDSLACLLADSSQSLQTYHLPNPNHLPKTLYLQELP